MEETLTVEILTPRGRVALLEDVHRVDLRTTVGEMGILSGHEAFLGRLEESSVGITKRKGEERFASARGVVEVDKNRVWFLVASAEASGEIDAERARRAKERAEKRLAAPEEGLDVDRARRALRRAEVRLLVSAWRESLSRR